MRYSAYNENGIDHIDANALTRYIAGLQTQEMTGNYAYSDDEKALSIWYNSPYGIVLVDLHTSFLKVLYLSGERDAWYVYHLPEPADWEYINAIVPPIPTAEVELSDGTRYGGSHLTATVTKLVYQTGEAKEVLKDRAARPHEGSGIYGAKVYSAATVTFSMPLISEVEITVEAWDYDSSYTVTLTELADGLAFELPDFPAHYTITASFRGSNGIYDATFVFHLGNT